MRASRKKVDPRKEPSRKRAGSHPEIEGPDVDADIDTDIRVEEDELTAQSSHDAAEEELPPIEEAGLSVELEDLARQALAEATQQDNYESTRRPDDIGLHVINTFITEPGE